MKLKSILVYLLSAVMVLGVAGTITSCKDSDEDLINDLRRETKELQQQISDLANKCGQCQTNCETAIMQKVKLLLNDYQLKGNYATWDSLEKRLAGFITQTWLIKNGYLTKGQIDTLIMQKGYITADTLKYYITHDSINKKLEGYVTLSYLLSKGYMTKENLVKYLNDTALPNALKDYIKKDTLGSYLKVDSLASAIDRLVQKDTKFGSLVEALNKISTMSLTLDTIKDQVKANKDSIDTLKNIVNRMEDRLSKLEKKVDAITGRLNSQITNILVQRVYNPVIGSVSLPIGVGTDILLGYFGSITGSSEFPTSATGHAYNGNDGLVLTDADLTLLENNCGLKTEQISDGTTLFDGNLGTVYATINPVTTDFSNVPLTLENSLAEESLVKLNNVKKSNTLLTFGISRADAANGLYEMEANIDPEDAEKIKIEIQPGIKSAVKDAIQDRTASDFANLARIIYRQASNFLPALAVRASWDWTDENDNTVTEAVLSEYKIAATTFQPLSYQFLYDKSFRTLPALPDFGNLSFNFNTPNIDLGSYNFNINTPTVNFNVTLSKATVTVNLNDVTVSFGEFPISGYVSGDSIAFNYGPKTLKHVDLSNLAAAINDAVNSELDKILNELNVQLNAQVKNEIEKAVSNITKQIQNQFNDFLAQITTKVNEELSDVLKDIENQINNKLSSYSGKLERFTDKINAAINRVNNILSNPNHYMQPCLFYGANGNYNRMSTSKALPTQLQLAGGNAITLFPSSYNGEIITPAYRKFVAVTDVYTASASAKGGDSACMSALKAANSQEYICEAIPGNRLSAPLALQKVNGQPTTYEVVYQAMDYHGMISTNKYYVTVK